MVSDLYENGPVGEVRRGIVSGVFSIPNDVSKIVDQMIATGLDAAGPLRLPLGIDTDRDLRAAYQS